MRKGILYPIIFILAFGLFAWIFTGIFIYFIISTILSAILRPLANYINQTQFLSLRTPRLLAVLMSFVVLAGVILLFITLFVPVFSAQIEVLSGIEYDNIIARISNPLVKIEQFLIENSLVKQEKGFLLTEIRQSFVGFVQDRNFTLINNLVSYTGNFIIGLIAIIFITFFMLYEDGLIRGKLISLIPNSYFEVTISAITKIEMLRAQWVRVARRCALPSGGHA